MALFSVVETGVSGSANQPYSIPYIVDASDSNDCIQKLIADNRIEVGARSINISVFDGYVVT